MSQEQAPNILPQAEHQALQQEIHDVAQVAREADYAAQEAGVRFPDRHNNWVDGIGRGDKSTRMLGQMTSSHRIQNKDGGGRTDVYIHDRQPDVKRDIHSYTDRRHGPFSSTGIEMDVKRPGKERKVLRSDNPVVHKMLTRIALKDIQLKAEADIERRKARAA